MRNLKKALSLALALVMLLGMMMVGAGAAKFEDVPDGSDNQEAVEVMAAISIIKGDEDGFRPDDTLNRAEAAVIISKVLLTAPVVEKLAGVESRFTDMAGYEWAIPYVEACATPEIIVGNGDGTFDPASKVTGVAFAKMLLVTIGFDPDTYNGKANWELLVRQDAIKAGLTENGIGVISSGDLSRADAAQMAFNAITEYSPSGATGYVVDGVASGVFDTWFEAFVAAGGLSSNAEIAGAAANKVHSAKGDTLAKTRFGLSESTTPDAYGREVKTWNLEGVKDPVYQAAESTVKPVATYTAAGVKADAVKKATGASSSSVADTKIYTNGTVGTGEGSTAVESLCKDGYTVEVYAANNAITKVIVIKPEIVTVAKVDEAKNTFTAGGITIDEKSDFANLIGQVQKGDKLVAVKQGNKFLSLEPAEIVTGTMTALSDKGVATVAGQKFSKFEGRPAITNENLGKEVNVVVVNGYAWSVDEVTGDTVDTKAGDGYIWVTNIWVEAAGSYGATKVVYALGVLADGTTKTLTLEKGVTSSYDASAWNAGTKTATAIASITTAGHVVEVIANPEVGAILSDDVAAAKQGLYKYYEAENKGAILEYVTATTAASGGITATQPQIGDKFVSTDVAMVWVSGSADKLAGNVTAREAIKGSAPYYAITDENGRIAVIFLKADASVAASELVFVTAAGDQTIYTDKDGKTQKGRQVTYYVAGETESKTMVVKNWSDGLKNAFVKAEADGDGFILGVKDESANIKYATPTHTMYNGVMIIGGDAVVDVSDAVVVDLVNGKDDKITSVEELEAYISADITEKKVTMIVENSKAETVYLVPNTDGMTKIYVDDCSKLATLADGVYVMGANATGTCDCSQYQAQHNIGAMTQGTIVVVWEAQKAAKYCVAFWEKTGTNTYSETATNSNDAFGPNITHVAGEHGFSYFTTTQADLEAGKTYQYKIFEGSPENANAANQAKGDDAVVIKTGTISIPSL